MVARVRKAQSNVKAEQVVVENKLPTDEQMRESGMTSLSARIRHLHSLGVSTSEIAKTVKRENGEHPRYQHVRNVLMTQLKKPVEAAETTSDDD